MRPVWRTAAISIALLAPALFLAYHASASERRPRLAPVALADPALQNVRAFLLMIQYAEGTYGSNAYHTMYGGSLFSDLSRHPNRAISKGRWTSTAAGAYQFLYRTWAELQQQLQLPDFSPTSQDRGAIELIRRKGALSDVQAGRVAAAIYKVRKVWASLPGAGYGQGERSLAALLQVYQQFGGIITT